MQVINVVLLVVNLSLALLLKDNPWALLNMFTAGWCFGDLLVFIRDRRLA